MLGLKSKARKKSFIKNWYGNTQTKIDDEINSNNDFHSKKS